MLNLFNEKAFSEVVAQLGNLGYRNALLEKDYEFADWFANKTDRVAAAAAFGRTPSSYETACIGVVTSNGLRESALIDEYRALGAPVILEVDSNELRAWEVSSKPGAHGLLSKVSFDNIRQLFVDRAAQWTPSELLRAKNIGTFHTTPQLSLFSGLVPELESRIQSTLEPLLNRALEETQRAYRQEMGHNPHPSRLFKLIFWILTAKVFYDRRVPGFKTLSADADEILRAIGRRYNEDTSKLLNKTARDTAVAYVWNDLDFRNLSVEVLSQMWSTLLIDAETKKRLGIQRTSRNIVRYIVEKLQPFEQYGDDERIIFEPCSGSAGFLVGAMNALRPNLVLMTPQARHSYFKSHLVAMEKDPVGVEISRLALTLADFPNLGGWQIHEADVFGPGALKPHLSRSAVVLCNPPFERFDADEKALYPENRSPYKPAELLHRVLDDLHPSGVLGFVLPRVIVDGNSYKDIRRRISERFGSVVLTVLPDRAFEADVETGLLIATEPIPHDTTRVAFGMVSDTASAWNQFELKQELTYQQTDTKTTLESEASFANPALAELWKYLAKNETINDVAELHRGLEWNVRLTADGSETGNRDRLERSDAAPGYILGVPTKAKFDVFQVPTLRFLNCEKQYQRRGFDNYPWDKPKAILVKNAQSRGAWKMSAFADTEGIACTTGFYGVWPKSNYDETVLAAILNSPLANAFVATREGKTNITKEIVKQIPVPKFSQENIRRLKDLVAKYTALSKPGFFRSSPDGELELLLKQIDALVLDAYRLPPRLEHELLRFFDGYSGDRHTSHAFTDYLPPDQESYFPLSTHLSPRFQRANAGAMRAHFGIS